MCVCVLVVVPPLLLLVVVLSLSLSSSSSSSLHRRADRQHGRRRGDTGGGSSRKGIGRMSAPLSSFLYRSPITRPAPQPLTILVRGPSYFTLPVLLAPCEHLACLYRSCVCVSLCVCRRGVPTVAACVCLVSSLDLGCLGGNTRVDGVTLLGRQTDGGAKIRRNEILPLRLSSCVPVSSVCMCVCVYRSSECVCLCV